MKAFKKIMSGLLASAMAALGMQSQVKADVPAQPAQHSSFSAQTSVKTATAKPGFIDTSPARLPAFSTSRGNDLYNRIDRAVGSRNHAKLDALWQETLKLDKQFDKTDNVAIRRLVQIVGGYKAPRKNIVIAELLNWTSSKMESGSLHPQTGLVDCERVVRSVPLNELKAEPLASAVKKWTETAAAKIEDKDLKTHLNNIREIVGLEIFAEATDVASPPTADFSVAPAEKKSAAVIAASVTASVAAPAETVISKTHDVSQTIHAMMDEAKTLNGPARQEKVLATLNVIAEEAIAFKTDRHAQEKAAGFMQKAVDLLEPKEREGDVATFIRTWVRKTAKNTDIARVSALANGNGNGNGKPHDNLPGALTDLLKATVDKAVNTKYLKAKWERVAFGAPQLRVQFIAAAATTPNASQHVALVVTGALNQGNVVEKTLVTVQAPKPRARKSATNETFATSASPTFNGDNQSSVHRNGAPTHQEPVAPAAA